ncbi:MFS transporter [Janthinobacterium sp.]|uniref:MFS transporter n=1 Tax=Janthinobacterium sp. TaxID=1871054 RepID=UPI00293D229C|nr:MFS transporter [Janthinobacterium sp.]
MRGAHPIAFIALGLFGVYCIEFGVVGVLPLIIARFQVTAAQAGLLVGSFALIIAALGPLLVLAASRFPRKAVLATALFIFALASVASAYAPSLGALMALRVLPALFHPIYFSLAMVAAMALYPPQQATRATTHAFTGTSMGMVLGIPITTWVATRFSYEASFLACAAINAVAGIGLLLSLPDAPARKLAYGRQLAILRKPALWWNIAACTLVFAAMFSVYAYAAEYLKRVSGLGGSAISGLLFVFGVGGVLGNLVAGRLLTRNVVRTALLQVAALALAYAALALFADVGVAGMAAVALFWGAAHTSGLVVTQIWLTSEAGGAPEFATGLYISFINLGVTIGSLCGGWCIGRYGMSGVIWSGLVFAALAAALIVAKVALYGAPGRPVGLPARP